MKYLFIVTIVLSTFMLRGESFRVFVDAGTVKTGNKKLSVQLGGTGNFIAKRYGQTDALELQAGASLTLTGQSALLPGPYGTVEMRFSPRHFRMDRAQELRFEIYPVKDCWIQATLTGNIWNFLVNYQGKIKRYWIPVYSWYSDKYDITRQQQQLTISIGFKGLNLYLNGLHLEAEKYNGEAQPKPEGKLFRLASAAPFEFISLYVTEVVSTQDQTLDRYVSLLSGKKMLDRAFMRIPRSYKTMRRDGKPQISDFDDAVALCGMNDVFTGFFIQEDLQYFLKYDDQHLYLFSSAPEAAKRRLGFFVMLKYTETFDHERFTLNPWQPLAGAGSKTKWFTRTTENKGFRLDEAWLENFNEFGAEIPHPGVTWNVNFSNWSSPTDRGVWYKSEIKNIQSYGLMEFGGKDDLFARLLVPPTFAGGQLKVQAECVNPSARIRKFDFSCELFRPDGEIISQQVVTGQVAADARSNNTLSIDTGNSDTMLLKIILRDDEDRIFYLRTLKLKRN